MCNTIFDRIFTEKQPIKRKVTQEELWGVYYADLQRALQFMKICKECLILKDELLVDDVCNGKPYIFGRNDLLKVRDEILDDLFIAMSRAAAFDSALDAYPE